MKRSPVIEHVSGFEVEDFGPIMCIRPRDQFADYFLGGHMLDEIIRLVTQRRPLKLMLSLSNSPYIQSSLLTRICVLQQLTDQYGGEFRLCGISTIAEKILELTQLDQVLNIRLSEADIIQEWQACEDEQLISLMS